MVTNGNKIGDRENIISANDEGEYMKLAALILTVAFAMTSFTASPSVWADDHGAEKGKAMSGERSKGQRGKMMKQDKAMEKAKKKNKMSDKKKKRKKAKNKKRNKMRKKAKAMKKQESMEENMEENMDSMDGME